MSKPLTGAQVAALAGISASGVSKLKGAADPLHRGPGGYDPAVVGAWLYRRVLASIGAAEGDALDLSREQALLARARRQALEREAEIRAGTYTLTSAAVESARRAGNVVRDSMLSIPGRVAATLIGQTDERRIDKILTTAIRDELTRVADMAAE